VGVAADAPDDHRAPRGHLLGALLVGHLGGAPAQQQQQNRVGWHPERDGAAITGALL